jgi:hypothetical protein
MTPLAQKILNELTLPKKDRTFDDKAGLLALMTDIHCFECSAILDLVFDLFGGPEKLAAMEKASARYSFLPAPKTWIEFDNPVNQARTGYLLIEDGDLITGYVVYQAPGHFWSVPFYFQIPHIRCEHPDWVAQIVPVGPQPIPTNDLHARALYLATYDRWRDGVQNAAMLVPAFLSFINTPRVIGRRQHMPHAGLQRKLAHARGLVGKFPLHAWTEIRLEVSPPRIHRSATGEPVEARLTGAKAQHFCRCHLRVRLGQLELVTAHWRGDPALGMKQSRYRLVMPPGTGEIHA